MKKFLLLTLLSFFLTETFAQSPVIEWEQSYGGSNDDEARAIRQTKDSGFIIGGISSSIDGQVTGHHGGYDYWLVKINSIGILEWEKAYGGTGDDYLQSVEPTDDGGYILAGYTDSHDGDVTGNHGGNDYWVVKVDSTGTIQWQKSYGGSNEDYASCIRQTNDHGYILAGYTYSNDGDVTINHGMYDYWVIKLDSIGAIQWQQSFGGSGSDQANYIEQTLDRGFVVCGLTGSAADSHGGGDCWVLKLDSVGNTQWAKSYGGSQSEIGYAIHQTKDRGYIVAGSSNSNDGQVTGNHLDTLPMSGHLVTSLDYWVFKIDSEGNLEWQKSLGGSKDDQAYNIAQTMQNGYMVIGQSLSNNGDVIDNHGNNNDGDYWIVGLDSLGNLQWTKSFGGTNTDFAFGMQETKNGYVIAGESNSNDGDVTGNHGNYDFWVVEFRTYPDGVNNIAEDGVKIYPVPAIDRLNISDPEKLKKIQMTDILGQSFPVNLTGNSIDISALAPGIYYLNIDNSNISKRFIKE